MWRDYVGQQRRRLDMRNPCVTTCQEAEIATDVLFTALGVAWDESQREGVAIGRRGLDDLLGRSTRATFE